MCLHTIRFMIYALFRVNALLHRCRTNAPGFPNHLTHPTIQLYNLLMNNLTNVNPLSPTNEESLPDLSSFFKAP